MEDQNMLQRLIFFGVETPLTFFVKAYCNLFFYSWDVVLLSNHFRYPQYLPHIDLRIATNWLVIPRTFSISGDIPRFGSMWISTLCVFHSQIFNVITNISQPLPLSHIDKTNNNVHGIVAFSVQASQTWKTKIAIKLQTELFCKT